MRHVYISVNIDFKSRHGNKDTEEIQLNGQTDGQTESYSISKRKLIKDTLSASSLQKRLRYSEVLSDQCRNSISYSANINSLKFQITYISISMKHNTVYYCYINPYLQTFLSDCPGTTEVCLGSKSLLQVDQNDEQCVTVVNMMLQVNVFTISSADI